MDSLLRRYPALASRAREAMKAIECGDSSGLDEVMRDICSQAIRDGIPISLELAKLFSGASDREAVRSGLVKAIEGLNKVLAGDRATLYELCEAYDRIVFSLRLSQSDVQESIQKMVDFLAATYAVVAMKFAEALAPHCEERGVDSAPLFSAATDPTLERAIAANAVVQRLRFTGKQGPDEDYAAHLLETRDDIIQAEIARMAGYSSAGAMTGNTRLKVLIAERRERKKRVIRRGFPLEGGGADGIVNPDD